MGEETGRDQGGTGTLDVETTVTAPASAAARH
jgi:hypothetical protein